jgi:hypothetical protein
VATAVASEFGFSASKNTMGVSPNPDAGLGIKFNRKFFNVFNEKPVSSILPVEFFQSIAGKQ